MDTVDLERKKKQAIALAKARVKAKSKAAGAKQPSEQDISAIGGFAREGLMGLSLGSLDEILATVEGAKSVIGGGDFMPAFRQKREEISESREKFKEKYGPAAFAAEMAGALPLGIASGARLAGAKLLTRLGVPSLGAGVYGFLGADGDLEERTKSALISAPTGLLGAGAGELISAGVGAVKPAARELMSRGVRLTPGQAMGGGTEYLEGLLGKTLIGDVAGISASQRKAYETFNKELIEEGLSSIGFKAGKDQTIKETMQSADDAIRDAFTKAKAQGLIDDATPIFNVVDVALDNQKIRQFGLAPDLVGSKLGKILDDVVVKRIEDNKMSADFLQDSLSSLFDVSRQLVKGKGGPYGKGLDKPTRQSLSRYLGEIQQDIMAAAVRANPENIALKNVRDAYRPYLALKKGLRKREMMSPKQAMEAMEDIGGSFARGMPGYSLAQASRDVLGEATAPRNLSFSTMPFGRIAGSAGLAGGGALIAPATTATLAAGLPAIYRTGAVGLAAGRGLLRSPAAAAQLAARTPSFAGILGPTLTEE